MKIQVASRLNGVGEYYFSRKLKEIEMLNRQGNAVINLGIGSPDLPPHPEVIKTLQEEVSKENVHDYQSYKGAEVLRNAFSQWYRQWFSVELDPASEILPLIGSKEGIMHLCMTYLNQGDKALVPNPGYPTYRSAVQLAGGICSEYLLEEETNFPNLSSLEKMDTADVKLMFVNYPHMPTGEPANKVQLEKMVQFAEERNILIVYDNPYSFILNEHPFSLLSIDGAKKVAVELNSLSKSHNMAGWRVGALCGAASRIEEVLRFKSNMDSGMFLPVQLAAAKALSLGKEWFDSVNEHYKRRRLKAHELIHDILNFKYVTNQAGMFLWARVPSGYETGFELSDEVLNSSKVFITPGGIFGSAGEKFIRVSLCSPEEKFDQAINRVRNIKGIETL